MLALMVFKRCEHTGIEYEGMKKDGRGEKICGKLNCQIPCLQDGSMVLILRIRGSHLQGEESKRFRGGAHEVLVELRIG